MPENILEKIIKNSLDKNQRIIIIKESIPEGVIKGVPLTGKENDKEDSIKIPQESNSYTKTNSKYCCLVFLKSEVNNSLSCLQ